MEGRKRKKEWIRRRGKCRRMTPSGRTLDRPIPQSLGTARDLTPPDTIWQGLQSINP